MLSFKVQSSFAQLLSRESSSDASLLSLSSFVSFLFIYSWDIAFPLPAVNLAIASCIQHSVWWCNFINLKLLVLQIVYASQTVFPTIESNYYVLCLQTWTKEELISCMLKPFLPLPVLTFGIMSSMNFCPPKPGSTVMTRAMSIWLAQGASSSTVVPGFMAKPTYNIYTVLIWAIIIKYSCPSNCKFVSDANSPHFIINITLPVWISLEVFSETILTKRWFLINLLYMHSLRVFSHLVPFSPLNKLREISHHLITHVKTSNKLTPLWNKPNWDHLEFWMETPVRTGVYWWLGNQLLVDTFLVISSFNCVYYF